MVELTWSFESTDLGSNLVVAKFWHLQINRPLHEETETGYDV